MLMPTAGAQEGVDKFRILPVDENSKNEKQGVFVRTIDFSFAKGKRYALKVYLDFFKHRKWFQNRYYEMPIYDDRNQNRIINMGDITVTFQIINGSMMYTGPVALNGRVEAPHEIHKNKNMRPEYRMVPFEIGKFELGKKYPVLLYGSVWTDSSGEVKFCTQKEFSPDDKTKNDCLDSIPHYVVLTLQLTEDTDE